ncbi:MAG TPA: hypothetical protein VM554_11050 [Acidisarcina sp.]|nr:hypothetical protein [Acidisarcina sp.]
MKHGSETTQPPATSQPPAAAAQASSSAGEATIPEQQAIEIRRLVHDLSNGLEIIIQSSYLLGTAEMPEESRRWVKVLEQGVEQAARINQELRAYIHAHS